VIIVLVVEFMFKLIPQLILIASIVTIIVIVLRRLPQVTIKQGSEHHIDGIQASSVISLQAIWKRFRSQVIKISKLVIDYAKEAKDHTAKAHYLKRFSNTLRVESLKSQIRGRTRGAAAHLDQAADHVDNNDFQSAEKSLLIIIEKDPRNKAAYENLGKLYLEQKKYSDALEVYEHLTKENPADDTYFSKLGLVYFNLSNFDKAIESYNKSIELRPDASHRLINLSLCFESKGEVDKAIEVVERALAISPDNPKYMLLLADFLIQTEKKGVAKEVLEKILELEPTNSLAREKLMQLKF